MTATGSLFLLILCVTSVVSGASALLFSYHAHAQDADGGLQSIHSLPLLATARNPEATSLFVGGAEIRTSGASALFAYGGLANVTAQDVVAPQNGQISIYVVREGDTLSEIAEMFGVSPNTIKWANDIPADGTIRIGQTLSILPVSGVKHIVEKGETLASIVEDYGGEIEEVKSFNGISDTSSIKVGMEILIPHGELPIEPSSSNTPSRNTAQKPSPSTSASGYYIRPLKGGVRTQGIHGYNAVDIGAPIGTSVLSSADGMVIISKAYGWNGGYGSYVVIKHDNGSQTLYAHLSETIVGVGQKVVQGQVIGYVGNSGRSTGPHLHFEIRGGGTNPF